jgi:hypothetical protein
MSAQQRFRDPHTTIYNYMDEYLVVCPRCAACAQVILRDAQQTGLLAPRRFICTHCGRTKDWQGRTLCLGTACDSYFGLPLWLQITVDDNLLWAYNLRHLHLIAAYVQATLRERRADAASGWQNTSLINRLPGWIKQAKHRRRVLKAVRQLNEKLDSAG